MTIKFSKYNLKTVRSLRLSRLKLTIIIIMTMHIIENRDFYY